MDKSGKNNVDEDCYFEINNYGFMQKRIKGENLKIERADKTRGLEMK
jgi:hypothetical protein